MGATCASRARLPISPCPWSQASKSILRRGVAAGLFRSDVDPIQLYVSITAMSYFHVSNRYTLSAMFDKDLGEIQTGWSCAASMRRT